MNTVYVVESPSLFTFETITQTSQNLQRIKMFLVLKKIPIVVSQKFSKTVTVTNIIKDE